MQGLEVIKGLRVPSSTTPIFLRATLLLDSVCLRVLGLGLR